MTAVNCMGALTPLASGASVSPDQILFESRGVVLVLGDDASVGAVAQTIARHHRTVVFAPGVDALTPGSRVTAVGRRVTTVRGHLGAFQAEVRSASGVSDIGAASPNPSRFFDLVLDLSQQPLIAQTVAPLGYFAPGVDESARAAAIESMRALVGRFTKPRYFQYQPGLCAHGASGLRGCTRCLDVCSAQAIVSAGTTIRVDPYLCQGCATCALACPTGALSFKFLSHETLADRLQQTLRSGLEGSTLIVHASTLGASETQSVVNAGALSLLVNPLPAFGEELWLRALALGVGVLILVDDGTLSERTRTTMTSQLVQVRAMLPALGVAPESLLWITKRELVQRFEAQNVFDQRESASPFAASILSRTLPSAGRPKRRALLDTLRELKTTVDTPSIVDLPSGASFGEILVNPQRCTLCFACTQLCPTGALVANNDKIQQLVFRESACVQCGLCEQGCPEKAIKLHARFAPSALDENTTRVLYQDEQLACKSCGTPFISRRLLASSLERLKGHPLLAKGGRESLMTCPSCRQRGMLNDS